LTIGDTNANVAALQTFLLSNGYSLPSISSGMSPKGGFTEETRQAVMKYQAAKGIPNTGFFGPMTRAAMNACPIVTITSPVVSQPVTCPVGYTCNTSATTTMPRPVYTPTPSNSPVPVVCPAGYTCNATTTQPVITSIVPSVANVGTIVTLHGRGLYLGNALTEEYVSFADRLDTVIHPSLVSFDGSYVTFTVPNLPSGSYNVSVEGKGKRSSYITLTVTNTSPSPSASPITQPSPTISYLSQSSGQPGTRVTMYGNNFCLTANSVVTFSNATHDTGDPSPITSTDGKTVTFTVPAVSTGSYQIFVESSMSGRTNPILCKTSNPVNFTVTSPYTSPTPVYYSPTPTPIYHSPTPVPVYYSPTPTPVYYSPTPIPVKTTVNASPTPSASASPRPSTSPSAMITGQSGQTASVWSAVWDAVNVWNASHSN
jgi:hypothetical protein